MSFRGKLATFALLAAGLLAHAQTAPNRVAQISSAMRAGNFAQAVELADQGLAASPNDSQLWTLKGIALSAQKHTTQALDAYHHALKTSPNYLSALEGAAQIQYNAGDREAGALLRRITRLRP